MIASAAAGPQAVASAPYSGTPAAIPGQINAETFDTGGEGVAYHDSSPGNTGGTFRSTDVDLEASSGGGFDVGWTTPGEWLNYTVNVGSSGAYSVQLRVASPGGASMHVGFNGLSPVWKTVTIPATGGWQNWTTVTLPVTLSAGTQIMTVLFDNGGMNLGYTKVTTGGSSTSPYFGSPVLLPGIVRAETFDTGGEGVAYHDSSPGNTGGAFRSTDVDLEASSGGGYDVGWTTPGEWLNYTVNVGSSGAYSVQLRVASPGGASMHVGFNGLSPVWNTVTIPATGGWQNWTTVSVPVVLGAGVQQITVLFDTGSVNLNTMIVAAAVAAPSVATLSAATWNIQVNDNSETHARVAIDTLLAIGPQPQVIVIEEAYSTWFNVYVDELQRQTGRAWHGVFATHCQIGNWNGSSCTTSWDQGVGIFSTYDIVNSSSMFFAFADCWTAARVGLRAGVNVNGTILQVFAMHLQTGGCANDMQSRYNSMSQLKTWAASYSTPQIAAGDFNADANQIDTTSGMLPAFVDTWSLVGTGRGFSAFGPSPTMKLDYWFADAGGRAQPVSSQVYYGALSLSDHLPVQTTFVIR